VSFGVLILAAIGGALVLEGFVWAVFPSTMRQAFRDIINVTDDRTLHRFGTVAVVTGVVIIAMIYQFLI